jgi:hypothetical protein
MPNATNNYKPQIGDTFNIININLPKAYILAAEQKGMEEAVRYMSDNNEEQFTFSVTLSRIFFQHHKDVLAELNEYSKLQVEYAGKTEELYVTSFTYTCKESEPLPEIAVELSDTVSVGESFTKNVADRVESIISNSVTKQDGILSGLKTGNSVDIVGVESNASPSDTNVFSALRSMKEFLSKTSDDTAAGRIAFAKGWKTPNYVESIYAGRGAGMDANGNLEVESLKVRSSAQFLELVVNRLTAYEGDDVRTETDTIDSVVDLGDKCYGLYLRSKWDGYFTGQVQGNVIKGIINTLARGSGTYYTSWMRVNSVNRAKNYIEVVMYPDDEVPAGKNYPPCEMMTFARWGNQTDTSRQSCIYISSTEGGIFKLKGVTKPILDDWNYGATLFTLPDWLKDDVRIDPSKDYVYAMGVVCQSFIQVDYKGEPIATYVDRGNFVQGETYYCRSMNTDGQYEISDVWYMGCKWRCMKDLTEEAPAWNSTDWAMIEGNPDFTVEFEEMEQLYDIDNFEMPLTILAKLYNIDVTDDILDSDVEWTRYSEDADGNPRTASDNVWALEHSGYGKAVTITYDDLGASTSSGFPKKVVFTATVTLRDGMGETAATNSVSTSMF